MVDLDKVYSIALSNVIDGTDNEYVYRKITRFYSQKFKVSLKEARALAIEEIALDLYESHLEEMDEEELDQAVERFLNPNFDQDEEASIQEFIKKVEQEEASKQKKPLNATEKTVSKTYDLPEEA